MRIFFLSLLLWALALSPVPAEAATGQVVHCPKEDTATIVAIVARYPDGDWVTCRNTQNGGRGSDADIMWLVKDATSNPQSAWLRPETPTKYWYWIHQPGESSTVKRWTSYAP